VAVRNPATVQSLQGSPTAAESRPGRIGPIGLGVKQTGERSAGNLHAAFDEAGAGNVARSRWCDTRRRKGETTGNTNFDLHRRASPRPYLGARGGEIPPRDSTGALFSALRFDRRKDFPNVPACTMPVRPRGTDPVVLAVSCDSGTARSRWSRYQGTKRPPVRRPFSLAVVREKASSPRRASVVRAGGHSAHLLSQQPFQEADFCGVIICFALAIASP
jgi:hypothetical protein